MNTLKVYHRVVGDPPSRGFDDALISPGFPVNPGLTRFRSARVPMTGSPARSNAAEKGKLMENQRVFEVMALPYGQVMLIHSAVGSMSGSRAHAYSDFALPHPTREQRLVLGQDLNTSQLLQFDDFLQLDWFWGLDKTSKTLPVMEWQVPASKEFAFEGHLNEELLDILLVHYWRAASQRVFAGIEKNTPLRVCLGKEDDGAWIIQQAKALMVSKINANLPLATKNIMSMSAAVSGQHIMQKFPDAALVLVYPEKQERYDIDLGSGISHVQISDTEKAFITYVRAGNALPILDEMLALFAKHEQADLHTCPLLADYELAYTAYCVMMDEADGGQRLPAVQLPGIWHGLYKRLSAGLHWLNRPEQVDEVMAPFTTRLMSLLTRHIEGSASDFYQAGSIAQEDAQFMLGKALILKEKAGEAMVSAMVSLQSLRYPPFITTLLENQNDGMAAHESQAANLLGRVLWGGYFQNMPAQEQLDLLQHANFYNLCRSYPLLFQVMQNYSSQLLDQHPDEELLLLPLSIHFGDKEKAQRSAIERLSALHQHQLPDARQQTALGIGLQNLQPEQQAAYEQYLCAAYFTHKKQAKPVFDLAASLGLPSEGALRLIYNQASTQQLGNDAVLTWEQIQGLQQHLLGAKPPAQETKQSLEGYIKSLRKSCDPWKAMAFLDANPLGTKAYTKDLFIQEQGLNHAIKSMEKSRELPTGHDFNILLAWCKTKDVLGMAKKSGTLEDWLKKQYEDLSPDKQPVSSGKWFDQTKELVPLLNFSKDDPAQRFKSVAITWIQDQFSKSLKTQGYVDTIQHFYKQMQKAAVSEQELLGGIADTVRKVLSNHFSNLKSIEDFQNESRKFEQMVKPGPRLYAGSPGNTLSFHSLWNEKIEEAFSNKKLALFLNKSFENTDALQGMIDYYKRLQEKSPPKADKGRDRDKKNEPDQDEAIQLPLKIYKFAKEEANVVSLKVFVERTKEFIDILTSQKTDEDRRFETIQGLLRQELWTQVRDENIRHATFYQRVGYGLLCFVTKSGQFLVEDLVLGLFPKGMLSQPLPKDPYAKNNLGLLSFMAALPEALKKYDPAYEAHFFQAIQSAPNNARGSHDGMHNGRDGILTALKEYLERMKKDKGQFQQYFHGKYEAEIPGGSSHYK